MKSTHTHWLFLASIPLLVAACGGSDSKGLEPVPPEDERPIIQPALFENGQLTPTDPSVVSPINPGQYSYEITSETGLTAGTAIISGSGRVAVHSDSSDLLFARIAPDDQGEFEAATSPGFNAEGITNRTLSGTLNTDNFDIINTVIKETDSNTLIESAKLTRQAARTPIAIADIAGTFTQSSEDTQVNAALTMTLNPDGTVTGFDTSLCELSGQYQKALGTDANFEMKFTATNCLSVGDTAAEDRNGEYFALVEVNESLDSLTLTGTNGASILEATITNDSATPVTPLFENGDFPGTGDITPIVPGEYRYTSEPTEAGQAPADSTAVISGSGRIAINSPVLGNVFARIEGVEQNKFTAQPSTNKENRVRGIVSSIDNGSINIAIENTADGTLIEAATMTLQNATASLSASDIAGTYKRADDAAGGSPITLTLNADGTATGSDTSLCEFDGEFTKSPGTTSVFELRMTSTNCSGVNDLSPDDRNGEYFGLISVIPEIDSLSVRSTNGTNVLNTFITDIDSSFSDGNFESDFVSDRFEVQPSIVSQIDTGIFDFQEISLDQTIDPSTLDSGTAVFSPTGRLLISSEKFNLRTLVDGLNNPNKSFRNEMTNFKSGEVVTLTGSLNSEVGEDTEIIGNIQNANDGFLIARYRITRNADPNEIDPATLAGISDIYSSTSTLGEFTTTIVIDANGNFSGGDDACIYDGSVVTFDSVNSPVFEARYTAEQCSSRIEAPDTQRNGTFNLLGTVFDDGTGNKAIITFSVSNEIIEAFAGSN